MAARTYRKGGQIKHNPQFRVKSLPHPTYDLYQCFYLSDWFEGFREVRPLPLVNVSFSDLLLNPTGSCRIFIRADLRKNPLAINLRNSGRVTVPLSEAVIKLSKNQAVYICDESGKADSLGLPVKIWYRVDANDQYKNIRTLSDNLSFNFESIFAESGQISQNNMYEFDGYFSDLLRALKKEGFKLLMANAAGAGR